MTNNEHTIKIEKLVYGGDAMGRLEDGRAVFVPFALPGETVRIQLTEDKKRFARGAVLEVLETSPQRIEARCPHFAACGGCHYQNLNYDDQLKFKQEIFIDQLQRIGKFENPPVREIVPSPNAWNYRNHIQFHQAQTGEIGFMAANSHELVPISECHLPEATLNELWPQLELDNLEGLNRIGLRLGADDEMMLVLESDEDEAYDINIEAAIAAVQIGPEATHILSDTFYLEKEILGRRFRVSANSFFQVNTAMATQMVEHLLANLELTPESTVLDVYCGVGLFSAFIAPKVKTLIGVELSPNACEDFVENLDAFDNIAIYEDAAEKALPHLDTKADIVMVDPPRAGLAPAALDAIVTMEPHTIAYISCDPATLARDGKRLTQQGYTLLHVTPFDLFPQTYHIESISFWARKAA